MGVEIANPGAMLETVREQEAILQPGQFTLEDGWKLGLLAREQVLAHGGNAAVDVTAYGVQLFRCAVGAPSPNNARWIRRKMNLAMENGKSSLRVMLEMQLSGRSLEEFGLSAVDFALSGGSFPIRLAGQGAVGTLTISGLPQTHDHQMAAQALAALCQCAAPSILG